MYIKVSGSEYGRGDNVVEMHYIAQQIDDRVVFSRKLLKHTFVILFASIYIEFLLLTPSLQRRFSS